MISFIISFLSGYVTSLAGTVVPGGLNATAMELTMSKGKAAGLIFGFGAALIEMIYIRLTLLGITFFVKNKALFDILQWVMASLFFVAGVYIFIRSHGKSKKKKVKQVGNGNGLLHSFLLGLALKAINPAQIGFWIFWSTYLISHNLLKPEPIHYTVFCLGLGSATFTGYALYVYFGEYIQTRSFFTQRRFDRVMGIFLCVASLLWVARMEWL